MTLPFEMETVRLGNAAFEGLNNCYVLGTEPDATTTLIDTGIPTDDTDTALREGLAEIGVTYADVEQILLTHWHGDHAGLAGRIQAESDCTIRIHEADAPLVTGEETDHAPGTPEFEATITEWGMPAEKRNELLSFTSQSPESEPATVETFTDGARFDIESVELEAVHLPGHSAGLSGYAFDGHDGRELFAGDALLPYYTPNVGGADTRVETPLASYLDTLVHIVETGYTRAWPGHRGAIIDPTGRAADIIDHHRERTDRVVGVLEDGPATPWEVSAALFGDLHAIHILHGPGEAYAHLSHLYDHGIVSREDGVYELRESNPTLAGLFPDVSDYLRPGYEPIH